MGAHNHIVFRIEHGEVRVRAMEQHECRGEKELKILNALVGRMAGELEGMTGFASKMAHA